MASSDKIPLDWPFLFVFVRLEAEDIPCYRIQMNVVRDFLARISIAVLAGEINAAFSDLVIRL